MTKSQKAERARLLFGILSALSGIVGLLTGSRWLLGGAFVFAFLWFVFCVVCVNFIIDGKGDVR